MIDSRRKLLTEALGEEWCGDDLDGQVNVLNRTFAHTDDYEALRIAVINEHISEFTNYTIRRQYGNIDAAFNWWLTLTPKERNELICDFGIACLGWEVKE